MKVLYFTRGQSPHDLRFTEALSKTEHQVFVLCSDGVAGRTWPADISEIQWVNVKKSNAIKDLYRTIQALKFLISLYKPDLIHAGPVQSVAFLVALAGFHPLVTMSWGSDMLLEASLNLMSRWVTRFTLNRTDVLVGDCESVGIAAERFGFPLDRFRMFPWGVNLTHFTPMGSSELRQRLGWEKKVVLLSNRTMAQLYDVETIAHAFVIASRTNPELRLLLFGSGSHEPEVRKILNEGGVTEKVHFGGITANSDLPDVYLSADFYLSASRCDGSSVSLMEAMACGLPVILSDIAGNREWVQENTNGWYFAVGNIQELAGKISFAVNHPDAIATIKKQNRLVAEYRADWNQNFLMLLAAYQLANEVHKKRSLSR